MGIGATPHPDLKGNADDVIMVTTKNNGVLCRLLDGREVRS
jgi:hypothetical protein